MGHHGYLGVHRLETRQWPDPVWSEAIARPAKVQLQLVPPGCCAETMPAKD